MADGTYVLHDLNSTNGTFVNDEKVSGDRRIEHSSTLRFGEAVFQLNVVAPARKPAEAVIGNDDPGSLVDATVVTSAIAGTLDYLIVVEGVDLGRTFRIENDTLALGRDPRNQIVLADPKVSAFHARVQRGLDGGLIIEDRGSTNGTVVNGERLEDTHRLDENHLIQIGDTTLQFKRAG